MNATTIEGAAPATEGKAMLWTGRVLSILFVLFMLMDGGMKIVPPRQVPETMAALGWPTDLGTIHLLAAISLVGTALHVWSRTALLGAVLLTGYLGGAIACHVRIGNPLFSHTLFGVYLGLLMWGGLWLRDARLRAIFPVVR